MNKKGLIGIARVSILIIFLIILSFLIYQNIGFAESSAAIWTTDVYGNPKTDFAPDTTVYIHGSDFLRNRKIDVSITRPDSFVEKGFTFSDNSGSFVYNYQLNGIEGLYNVFATDKINTAQTTFTDSIDSECQDYGFDFGVAKWEWNNGWHPEGDSKGTSVTGSDTVADWNAGTSGADGIVVKAGQTKYAIVGTSGTLYQDTPALSHITFCGYEDCDYTNKNSCESDPDCDWCPLCEYTSRPTKVNQWFEARCVDAGTDCGWQCEIGWCDATCSDDTDCECPTDQCIGPDYYDYPDYGYCVDCPISCYCEDGTNQGEPCEPTVYINDPSCGECLVDEDCNDYNECTLGECVDYYCVYTPEPLSTPCETDQDLCTIDHCDGDGSCVNLDNVDCSYLDDQCQEGVCDSFDGQCYPNYYDYSTYCDNGLYCDGEDHCDGYGACVNLGSSIDCSYLDGNCQNGVCDEDLDVCVPDYSNYPWSTECEADDQFCTIDHCDGSGNCVYWKDVDCSDYNLDEIATCDWIPDDYHYTWDYALGFISECDEDNDRCTTGEQTPEHICADNDMQDTVPYGSGCGAECDEDVDCEDKCIDNIWYYNSLCNFNTCFCEYDTHDCDIDDDCYAYGTGCEDRDYFCEVEGCDYTYSNRNEDYYDAYEKYCSDDTIRENRKFHDFYCDFNCIDHESWQDDQLIEDCDVYDDWYDTGNIKWVETDQCNEKEQKEQKYRDYYCFENDVVECKYTETDTQWVDTDNTRYKPDDTPCDDSLYCTDPDVCTEGVCGGPPRDCSYLDDQCNDGICNEDLDRCEYDPFTTSTPCDNGLYCDGPDHCDASNAGGLNPAICVNLGSSIDCSYLDSQCQEGKCDEDIDDCVSDYYDYSTSCEADDDLCTVDHCDGSGSCVYLEEVDCSYLNDDYCIGTEIWHDEGYCDPLDGECYADPTPTQDCYYYDEYCDMDEIWYEQGYCNDLGLTPVCDYTTGFIEDCFYYEEYCEGAEAWYEEGYCNVVTDSCDYEQNFIEDCYYLDYYCDIDEVWYEEGYCSLGACDYDTHFSESCDNDYEYCDNNERWENDEFCIDGYCDSDDNMIEDCYYYNEYCDDNEIWYEEGYCNDLGLTTVCNYNQDFIEDCVDEYWCNGDEYCSEEDGAHCEEGTPVDCSYVDGDCQEGICDEFIDVCVPDYTDYPFSTACEADQDICTIDHCDGYGSCVFLEDYYKEISLPIKVVGEPKVECEEEWCDYKITTLTPITLTCENETQVKWRYALDGEWNEWHTDESPVTIYFQEECNHTLEAKCIDECNEGPTDTEIFKVEGTSFEIPLFKKWNLISVPFKLLNEDTGEVFKDIKDKIISIWTYDPSKCGSDGWCVWTPSADGSLNLIEPGWGYWVLAKNDTKLLISGNLFSPITTPPSKNLQSGWNLIGYYGTEWQTYQIESDNCGYDDYKYGNYVYCALNSLIDTQVGFPRWSSLWGYDNCGNDNAYWHQLESCVGDYWIGNKMFAGKGYWIEMDVADGYAPASNCIWNKEFKCSFPTL